ncbi:hypothetical protein C9374_002726 [Naegleria lovaniensis]|uniref:PCI domain-containing protein n=1 Tax=Naegleria lovaniensis TaxID=51637 RepID=A0AA88GSX4_NAELO|nr:uncharacterized protein C9374_002726 [Naegleria lovaniensis]KAG2386280.1 hypothetical protein C9374_002726 [Naegleria lovaniensis]
MDQDAYTAADILNEDFFYETFYGDQPTGKIPNINSIEKLVDSTISKVSYRPFLYEYFKSMIYLFEMEDYKNAFEFMKKSVEKFINQVFDKENYWSVKLMKFLSSALYRAAVKAADAQEGGTGDSEDSHQLGPLSAAAMTLQTALAASNRDRTNIEESKKWASLHITNTLIRFYFKLNNLDLCSKYIRSAVLNDLNYPLSELVTFRFFSARVAILQSKFVKAKEDLEYALTYCHEDYTKNKKMIIRYLASVNLMLGKYPTQTLCEKYDLMEFMELSKACRTGDLRTYRRCLAENMNFFINDGTYLILEKIKVVVYRNLLRRVYCYKEKSARIPIPTFLAALKFVEDDPMDLDEAECILSNLIFSGFVRGYISHDKQILVVAKQNPFPALSTLFEEE